MPNLETLTAPPSPELYPKQLDAPPALPNRPPPTIPKKTIRAEQSKCGICYRWMELDFKDKAVKHFNECWNMLREQAEGAKKQDSKKMIHKNEVEESDDT
jgi:hypothetical protein